MRFLAPREALFDGLDHQVAHHLARDADMADGRPKRLLDEVRARDTGRVGDRLHSEPSWSNEASRNAGFLRATRASASLRLSAIIV